MPCLEPRAEGLAADIYLVNISHVTDGIIAGHPSDSS